MDGNRRTKQEQRPKLAWAMPCEEEEGEANQRIVIDESLVREFEELEATQFDCCNPYYKDRVWGLFGEQDTLLN